MMKFYIVTPTYNSLNWLRCCIKSVADQVCEDVEIHHHVQDGCSTDGTPLWLEQWREQSLSIVGYKFTYDSEPDKGMYDAINKAWDKIPNDADITAHLNSDEQYLPGALREVSRAMTANKSCEIALTTYIVVDEHGDYICHRRPIRPHRWSSITVCEIFTCTCFHRVNYFLEHGIRFDPQWKSIGDFVMYREIINRRPKFLILPNVIASTFAVTGKNLAWTNHTKDDCKRLSTPLFFKKLHPFTYRWSNFKRIVKDFVCPKPKEYSIYIGENLHRTLYMIENPSSRWRYRNSGDNIE